MIDQYDFLFHDAPLDDSERRLVRNALAQDAALRRSVQHWLDLERTVENQFESALPDRSLLVLYVLERSGVSLGEDEMEALDAARNDLAAVEQRFVSFGDITSRIEADVREFDRCWVRHSKRREVSVAPDREAIRTKRPVSARWLWRIPVAATALFFIAVVVLLARRDAAFEHVATGEGETRLIEFADGTVVHLREMSRFSYVPSDRQYLLNKRARLEGRAFFEVAPQQAGLVVETPAASATILGTTFGLVADHNGTDVYLVEGRLSLAPQGSVRDAVTLAPGQHSRVEYGGRPSPPNNVDLADALAWTGFFVFRSTPLPEIAIRIGQHYGVDVQVAANLSQEHVTGTFDASLPVETIMEIVASAVDADVESVATGVFAIH